MFCDRCGKNKYVSKKHNKQMLELIQQQQTELQARLDRINAMLGQTEIELEGWQDFIRREQLKKLLTLI